MEKLNKEEPESEIIIEEEKPVIEETESTNKVDESSLPAVQDSKSDKLIDAYASTASANIQKKFNSGEIDASEAGKQAAHLIMTAESLADTDENKGFRKEFKDIKQGELLESAKASLNEEAARKLSAKHKKAEEFYTSYRPILEFDLDHLLIRNASKRSKLKRVYDEEKHKKVWIREDLGEPEALPERPKKTYAERSYGIPLMILMLLLLTLPYCLVTIILSVFNAVNYIFVAISRFTKPAAIICTGIAGLTVLGLVVYVIILCIQSAFNIEIIPKDAISSAGMFL